MSSSRQTTAVTSTPVTPAVLQDIAIGLLCFEGQVLIGWRHATQHQGNKYEFPGGKCEANENPLAACRREVLEEVGVDVTHWRSIGQHEFDYGDVFLRLHWFQASLNAAQVAQVKPMWQWHTREHLLNLPFPKANRAILARLQWPRHVKISASLASVDQLDQLKQLQPSGGLMYWRDNAIHGIDEVQQQLSALSQEQLQHVVLNWAQWQQLPCHLQAQLSTVHLKHSQLMQLQPSALRPQLRYVAACHDLASLQQAQYLGCDAVLLSPVKTTNTHPETTPLGWDAFATLAKNYALPIYALGGLSPDDLATAQSYGAYGVAGISNF